MQSNVSDLVPDSGPLSCCLPNCVQWVAFREGQAALCDTHDRGDVAAQALLSQLPGGDKEERRSDTLARISQVSSAFEAAGQRMRLKAN